MNKEFLEKMKNTLLSQQKEILNKSEKDVSIDVSGDETDQIQGNILLQLNKQLAVRDFNKLQLIDSALDRIKNNTYGICEDCEDDIAEKRLVHNPYFLTCISCAESREINQKQRKV